MRIPITVSFLLLCIIGLYAQNSPDCRTAIPICADAPVMGFTDGAGDIEDFDPDVILQTGCLEKGSVSNSNIENNTTWYVFRAGTGGQVGFDIEALPSLGNTVTAELDFAVYGPDTNCADISSGTAQPIRCNYEVNSTNFTGLGVNPANGDVGAPSLTQNLNTYDEYLDVLPGEIYYVLINNFNTNFNGDPEPYMFTFTGSSVDADQNNAIDCTLRDEFLGLDIVACEGDPDITLSALNSPAGSDIASVDWTVDYDDDGTIDATLTGSGPFGAEYVVTSPNSGRYFAEISTISGTPPTVADVGGILITFYGIPVLDRVDILEDILDDNTRTNNVEIFVVGDSSYEYAINGGAFQDYPVFTNIPVGINTVIINDKNGCGITEPIEFLVAGYPKFFTPNNDGVNDQWLVYGIETLTGPAIHIFDRYGKLLIQLDPNSGGWDGTYNGRPMPSTDYWFRLDFSRLEDNIVVARTIQSHFSLKR